MQREAAPNVSLRDGVPRKPSPTSPTGEESRVPATAFLSVGRGQGEGLAPYCVATGYGRAATAFFITRSPGPHGSSRAVSMPARNRRPGPTDRAGKGHPTTRSETWTGTADWLNPAAMGSRSDAGATRRRSRPRPPRQELPAGCCACGPGRHADAISRVRCALTSMMFMTPMRRPAARWRRRAQQHGQGCSASPPPLPARRHVADLEILGAMPLGSSAATAFWSRRSWRRPLTAT